MTTNEFFKGYFSCLDNLIDMTTRDADNLKYLVDHGHITVPEYDANVVTYSNFLKRLIDIKKSYEKLVLDLNKKV